MMTTDYTQDLDKYQSEIVKESRDYEVAILASVRAELKLDKMLSRDIIAIRGDRKTLSKENAIIELMAGNEIDGQNEEAIKANEEMKINKAIYMGKDKVIDAISRAMGAIQSNMKYDVNNGG
jgi:hypothetical protein